MAWAVQAEIFFGATDPDKKMADVSCTPKCVSRTRMVNQLKLFYFRIKGRHGAKVAIVALARKVICILHHLIVNREMFEFEDEATNKSKRNKPGRSFSSPEPTIADAIHILVRAEYAVQRRSEREGG